MQILPQPRPLHFPISFFSNIHTVSPFVPPFCVPTKSAKTSLRCCTANSFNASRVICESRKKSSSRIDTSQVSSDQRDSWQQWWLVWAILRFAQLKIITKTYQKQLVWHTTNFGCSMVPRRSIISFTSK